MSERMLSAIEAVEKGATLVFPAMSFSEFPAFMERLKQAVGKRKTEKMDK
ncbi:hypothetical protein IRM71_17815 (plasmid) [Erwinia amylovora]|uniref:Uncharacterized protein n=1 Tax=Enterobacter ludwigii TaxID=299767 RepID=A0AAX3LJ62_9ENTR|nr:MULTISPECIES: hypothetical protein [Enterobacterales]UDJ88633.1 hypothetical protein IRM68_17815 [Erwinia amylovora]UDK91334.1 hypothetical protein IRM70_17805 [Erwinia amylovora]UDK94738.1 hypothetical protein IRM71_17815 [Erwinia amylovora]UER93204.1 hypothetical protein IRM69_17895 [Erwinia amylovora]UOD76537.1 hypothetical protein IRM67_17710 [Erwinia amylovora]